MTHYRVTASPMGYIGTELVSGTVWGHLAWATRYLKGESALEHWLDEQEVKPWLVSSQMPAGMLPRPMLKPTFKLPASARLKDLELLKASGKTMFIREEKFFALRDKLNESTLTEDLIAEHSRYVDKKRKEDWSASIRLAHNRIDRISGRTPNEGGLYFEHATVFSEGARLQLFVQTPSPCKEELKTLFEFIGCCGFGANASVGCGQMRFEIQEEEVLFAHNGSRAMSLSHGILTANMQDPRYKQHTHYGKLGGHYSVGGLSPFKYPILMMRPGATFDPADQGPFGKLLADVHHDPALKGIRHHALHLPVYFNEVIQ